MRGTAGPALATDQIAPAADTWRCRLARGVGDSLLAATLGSAAGAIGYVLAELLRTGPPPTPAQWAMVPFAVLLVALVATVVAVPASLLLGPPMLAVVRGAAVRRPALAAIAFGVVGLLAAGGIHDLLDHGARNPETNRWESLLFGTTVGVAHPLVAARRAGARWRRTLGAAALAALALGAAGRLLLDARANARARAEYASVCRSGSAAFALRPDLVPVADAALRGGAGGARLSSHGGEWWPHHGDDALLNRYAALFVDGERALAVNDYALAPITPWSRLGRARRVEAHCLPTLPDAAAALARRAGLVRPPPRPPRPPRWW